jgi:hypothetical protein
VLDKQRRLVYAYRSAEPTDRPSIAALARAVEQASHVQFAERDPHNVPAPPG